MKNILSLLFVVFTVSGFSQTDTSNLYKANHFMVSVKDGLTKSSFTPTFGNDQLEERFGQIFQLQFDYAFHLKHNFDFLIRSNVGIGSFTYDLESKNGFYGTEGWNTFYRDSYNAFAKLGVGLNYHKHLKPRLLLNINAGLGLSINSSHYTSSSSISHTDEPGNSINENYDISYQYSDDLISFGFLDLGVNYVLKNKNLIGLSLSPEVFFKPTLSGNYSIYNNTSGGTISGNNNNISLGLNYIFTNTKKYEYNQKLNENGSYNKKDSKKAYKKEKRFVDPKSIFINVGSGLFFGRNIVDDANNKIASSSFPSWVIQANTEVGLKNQFYYEIGIDVAEYWESIKTSPYGASGSNAFIATKLSLGMSKRFINLKTNRNYFNLHAGVGISLQLSDKGVHSWGSGSFSSNNYYFSYSESTNTLRHVFPTLYLAIEKDLHLTKNLYFSMKYKYDQGFISASKTNISYSTDPSNGNTTSATSKINGTAHTVLFGFKYKFLPK